MIKIIRTRLYLFRNIKCDDPSNVHVVKKQGGQSGGSRRIIMEGWSSLIIQEEGDLPQEVNLEKTEDSILKKGKIK